MSENWIDRQIREARERGAFDNLPGEGKPLTGRADRPDPNWWIKQKMADEGIEELVQSAVSLRDEVKHLQRNVAYETNESDVREIATDLNRRIRQARARRVDGPPEVQPRTVDVELVVENWRARRR
ncbi:MAG: DUF1992 domain-containing protein [Propionibacteriaceae bacterium]